MKVYKKNLPDGIKKMFALEKGVKVKYLNKKYYDKKKTKYDLHDRKDFVIIILFFWRDSSAG